MSTRKAMSEPLDAIADHGEVLVDGTDGAVFSLTPEAAMESARRITRAAEEAQRQNQGVDPPR